MITNQFCAMILYSTKSLFLLWFVIRKKMQFVFNTFSGSVRVVRAEGMPQYRNPFEKGDLYVKFEVQFPQNNWISPEKLTV